MAEIRNSWELDLDAGRIQFDPEPDLGPSFDTVHEQDRTAEMIDSGDTSLDIEPEPSPQFHPDDEAYRPLAFDLVEWLDHQDDMMRKGVHPLSSPATPSNLDLNDSSSAIIDSGEALSETGPASEPSFSQYVAIDSTAQIIDAGNQLLDHTPSPEPGFGLHDSTAEIVDTGSTVSDAPEPTTDIGHGDHDDATARLIDDGELIPTFGPQPPLPGIDHDALEDEVVRIADQMLAALTQTTRDGIDRTMDGESFKMLHEIIDHHIHSSDVHTSLADEFHSACRKRIEGERETEHDLLLRWSPSPGKKDTFSSHRSAQTAARHFVRYWEPSPHISPEARRALNLAADGRRHAYREASAAQSGCVACLRGR